MLHLSSAPERSTQRNERAEGKAARLLNLPPGYSKSSCCCAAKGTPRSCRSQRAVHTDLAVEYPGHDVVADAQTKPAAALPHLGGEKRVEQMRVEEFLCECRLSMKWIDTRPLALPPLSTICPPLRPSNPCSSELLDKVGDDLAQRPRIPFHDDPRRH